MKGAKRAAWRRFMRELNVDPHDTTFGGLLPPEHRFPPVKGTIDVYKVRTDIRPEDLVMVDRGPQDADNLTSVLVSHTAAGVSAEGRAADAEQAFHQAMQQLRGRIVLIRLERELKSAVADEEVSSAGDCGEVKSGA